VPLIEFSQPNFKQDTSAIPIYVKTPRYFTLQQFAVLLKVTNFSTL